jgi:hypothetical protein
VPYNYVSRLTDITQKIAGKSDGKTIEWLYKKYWLSRIRPQQAIPSTTTINSNFNGAYLSPDDDSSIFATGLSIPSHNSQQNPAGRYEQDVFVEPSFNADSNSAQYEIAPSSHPWDFYIGDSANQLQHISYPQQQTFIQPNPSNFQSWMPNASKPNSTGFTSITQPCYPRNQWSLPDEAVTAGERLVGPPEDLSYYEQVWNPESTSFTSIPQSEPMIPQDHRYIGRMRQPTRSIMNNNNNAMSMNSPDLQHLCYQVMGGDALGEGPAIAQHLPYLGGGSHYEYRDGYSYQNPNMGSLQ